MGDSSDDLNTLLAEQGISSPAPTSNDQASTGFFSWVASLLGTNPVISTPTDVNGNVTSSVQSVVAANPVSSAASAEITSIGGFFSGAEPWFIGLAVLAGLVLILLILSSVKDIV